MKKIAILMTLYVLSFSHSAQTVSFDEPILIEYEGQAEAFSKLLSAPAEIKRLFPKIKTETPKWYEILNVDCSADAAALLKARDAILKEIPDDAQGIKDAVFLAYKIGCDEIPYQVIVNEKELSRLTVKDLLSADKYQDLQDAKNNLTSFRRYQLGQFFLFALYGVGYVGTYLDKPNKIWNWNSYWLSKKAIDKISSISSTVKGVTAFGVIVGILGYPLYRYQRLFSLGEIEEIFPIQVAENRIAVLRKRYIAYYIYTSDGRSPVYRYTNPIGYIPLKEWKRDTKYCGKGFNAAMESLLMSSIYSAGVAWSAIPGI